MRVLTLLIAAQVMAGLWLTAEVRRRANPPVPDGEFTLLWMGALLGQASLLGLWVGLSSARRATLWIGAVCGGLVLCAELPTAFRGWGDARAMVGSLILVFAPLCVVASVAARLRRCGMRLMQPDEVFLTSATEAIQFSLKQLLLLISAAAIVLAAARVLHAFSLLGSEIPLATGILLAICIGVVFAAQTLASLWATLGLGRWLWRLPAPFLLTALGGALMGYADGGSRDHYDFWIRTTVLQTVVVVVTLLVIRVLGYRLARSPPQQEKRGLLDAELSASDFKR